MGNRPGEIHSGPCILSLVDCTSDNFKHRKSCSVDLLDGCLMSAKEWTQTCTPTTVYLMKLTLMLISLIKRHLVWIMKTKVFPSSLINVNFLNDIWTDATCYLVEDPQYKQLAIKTPSGNALELFYIDWSQSKGDNMLGSIHLSIHFFVRLLKDNNKKGLWGKRTVQFGKWGRYVNAQAFSFYSVLRRCLLLLGQVTNQTSPGSQLKTFEQFWVNTFLYIKQYLFN